MNKSTELGYGYLYHFNSLTNLWECAHHTDAKHFFGTGEPRQLHIATGNTADEAAVNYIKKFKIKL